MTTILFILNAVASVLKEKYGVRLFTSGRMALDFLAGHTADLILLDYRMPDMTGFEILKELQGDPNARKMNALGTIRWYQQSGNMVKEISKNILLINYTDAAVLIDKLLMG